MGFSAGERSLAEIAGAYLEAVAAAFPVCAASDEFYFFPQALPAERDWSVWDDFSETAVGDFGDRLAAWEEEVRAKAGHPDEVEGIEGRLLLHSMTTLREQLTLLSPHRSQPTFHLTLLSLGLAEGQH